MLFQRLLDQSNEILNILYWILGISLAWVVLRFIFKLARKVFAIGCFGIIAIGGLMMILDWLQVM